MTYMDGGKVDKYLLVIDLYLFEWFPKIINNFKFGLTIWSSHGW